MLLDRMPWLRDYRALVAVAAPIAGIQLAQVALTTTDLAAHAVSNSILNLYNTTAGALTALTSTVCGQCYGARRYDLTRVYGKNLIKVGRFLMLATSLILYPLTPLLMLLYNVPAESMRMIYISLAIAAVGMPLFSCDSNITAMVLRVAGDGELQADDAGTLPHYFAGDPLGAGEAEFERLLGRPLPKEAASGAFGMNDPVCRLAKARSLKARLLCRLLAWLLRRGEARGKPMLALRSLYEMPPRALGKASGGVLNQRMCRGLCEIANGHALAFFKGLGGVIAGAAEQARNRRRVKRELP